jgi:hypothetical protein
MLPSLANGSGKTTDDIGERVLGFIAPTTAARLGQSCGPGGTFSAFDIGSYPVSMNAPLVECASISVVIDRITEIR